MSQKYWINIVCPLCDEPFEETEQQEISCINCPTIKFFDDGEGAMCIDYTLGKYMVQIFITGTIWAWMNNITPRTTADYYSFDNKKFSNDDIKKLTEEKIDGIFLLK